MPAVSQSQGDLMGMVAAEQEGKLKNASPKVKEMAAHMKPSDVHDFASTPRKGLPERKNMGKYHRGAKP